MAFLELLGICCVPVLQTSLQLFIFPLYDPREQNKVSLLSFYASGDRGSGHGFTAGERWILSPPTHRMLPLLGLPQTGFVPPGGAAVPESVRGHLPDRSSLSLKSTWTEWPLLARLRDVQPS